MAAALSCTTKAKLHKKECVWHLKNYSLYCDQLITSTKFGLEIDNEVIEWYFTFKKSQFSPSIPMANRELTIHFPSLTRPTKVFWSAHLYGDSGIIGTAGCIDIEDWDPFDVDIPTSFAASANEQSHSLYCKPTGDPPLRTLGELARASGHNMRIEIFVGIVGNSTSTTIDTDEPPVPEIPKQGLYEDFEVLFETKDSTADIIFVIEDEEFSAHKFILSVRSPVFAAMFNIPMKEQTQDKIGITDMDPEIFNEMLRFIYTNKVANIEENAIDLLIAADRFQLSGLKAACEEALLKGITVENAAKTFIYFDRCGNKELANYVKNFILKHKHQVMATPEYQLMVKLHSQLTIQLLSELLVVKNS